MMVLGMFAVLLYYFISGIEKYMRFPTNTKMNLYENKTLRFPAVTICNNNIVGASKFDSILQSHMSIRSYSAKLTYQ